MGTFLSIECEIDDTCVSTMCVCIICMGHVVSVKFRSIDYGHQSKDIRMLAKIMQLHTVILCFSLFQLHDFKLKPFNFLNNKLE